jgi:predicted ATPase
MDNSELYKYFLDGECAIYNLNKQNNLSIQDAVKQYNQDLLPGQHRFTRRQIILDSDADNIEEDIVLEDNKLQTQLNNYSYYWAMKKPSRF